MRAKKCNKNSAALNELLFFNKGDVTGNNSQHSVPTLFSIVVPTLLP